MTLVWSIDLIVISSGSITTGHNQKGAHGKDESEDSESDHTSTEEVDATDDSKGYSYTASRYASAAARRYSSASISICPHWTSWGAPACMHCCIGCDLLFQQRSPSSIIKPGMALMLCFVPACRGPDLDARMKELCAALDCSADRAALILQQYPSLITVPEGTLKSRVDHIVQLLGGRKDRIQARIMTSARILSTASPTIDERWAKMQALFGSANGARLLQSTHRNVNFMHR